MQMRFNVATANNFGNDCGWKTYELLTAFSTYYLKYVNIYIFKLFIHGELAYRGLGVKRLLLKTYCENPSLEEILTPL